MNTFLRNTISKLYNAVSAPVTATRDELAERLQSVRDTASLLYNRMMENILLTGETDRHCGKRSRRRRISSGQGKEEEAKKQRQGPTAAKEKQQDDDDERYDTVAKIKSACEGKRVNEFRVT